MRHAKSFLAATILMSLTAPLRPGFGQSPIRLPSGYTTIPDGPGPTPHPSQLKSSSVRPPPDFSLNVYFDQSLPDARKQALQPIKDLLNKAKIGVPDDRIAYFRTALQPNSREVRGWSGEIHSVKQIKGGFLVNLRIYAKQEGMFDSTNMMERYSIINGRISYIGSFVPNDIPRVQIGY